ncbi:MAG: beta-lactamase family protein [Dehalococcoidales bacterium]|nr:beta-lactamase family protein [Dehalococcoidales bacterium]
MSVYTTFGKYVLACLAILLFLPATGNVKAVEEGFFKTEMDDFIRERIASENIPGLSVVIVRNSEISYTEGFGVTSVKTRIPVTSRSVFDLASCSKSFTALAVMLLVNDRNMELDSPVNRYLTDLEFADKEKGAEITLRQLLNHTSGLPGVFSEPMAFHEGEDAMDKVIKAMKRVHLNREPGSSFEYSNMNYSILGALIERVSGRKFEDFVQQRIFTPLGMNNTTLYPEAARGLERAGGHQLIFGRIIQRDIEIYRSASAAGWVMSTAEDMGKWLKVHLDNGWLDGWQVVPEEVIRITHTPSISLEQNDQEVSYGMGWFISESGDGTEIIWHGGDTPNFVAEMILIPEYNAGLVMMVNGQTSPYIHTIALDILNHELGTDFILPEAPWWASWEAIDRIATGALGLSFVFIIGLIIFIWRKIRHQKETSEKRVSYRIWRIVLPSAPVAIISLSILAIFLIAEILLGYNVFRIVERFGEYAPPGVSISSGTLFTIICLWALALAGTSVYRMKRRLKS